MKDKAFIVGDVHGCFDELKELLESWNSSDETLVFLGDLVDRGPKIKETLDLARQLEREVGAYILKGNHEAMLGEVLTQPTIYWPRYERNGGLTTLAALSGQSLNQVSTLSYQERTDLFIQTCPWLKDWLLGLPLYVEFGDWIFVHAGVDLSLANWQDTDKDQLVWIRDSFHQGQNKTGKRFVFGHTPTKYLNTNPNQVSIWEQDGKYGIDGGAVYGGALLAIQIEKENSDYQTYSVRSKYPGVEED